MFDKDKIYQEYSLEGNKILIPKWGSREAKTISEVLDALFIYDKEAALNLGLGAQSLRKYIKMLFPTLGLKNLNNKSWESWFLSFTNFKKCSKCKKLKLRDLYSKDKITPDGLKHECKICIKNRTTLNPEYVIAQAERNKIRYQ